MVVLRIGESVSTHENLDEALKAIRRAKGVPGWCFLLEHTGPGVISGRAARLSEVTR